jgi:hypothetical protein
MLRKTLSDSFDKLRTNGKRFSDGEDSVHAEALEA